MPLRRPRASKFGTILFHAFLLTYRNDALETASPLIAMPSEITKKQRTVAATTLAAMPSINKNDSEQRKLAAAILGSSGGTTRASRMTSAQRSQSARYARSFGVGGKRRTSDIASQASVVADKIMASAHPKGRPRILPVSREMRARLREDRMSAESGTSKPQ